MATYGMKEIEERIGHRPFSGYIAERALNDGLDPSKASSISLRADLKLWLEKQGITKRSAQTAVDTSLVRAYANRPYLVSWRKRVNPGFDLLGGDEEETETAQDHGQEDLLGDSKVNTTVTDAALKSQFEELVKKTVEERFSRAKLELSAAAREEVKGIAELTTSVAVDRILAERLPPRQIEIKNHVTGDVTNLGVQHDRFPTLLKVIQAKNHMGYSPNVWLTGPTGSGKTTAVQNAAKALSLEFEAEGSLDADYKLMGHTDAHGKYVETAFFRRFTKGGIILLDEIDNYGPSALLALNAATSNAFCQFPCGFFERHKDCIIIACANTWGLGATNDYVGRTRLDAATLDRFMPKINWPVDEKLERAVADQMADGMGCDWHDLILKARAAVKRQGLKVIISPRATFNGIALLQQGFDLNEVLDMTILAGLSQEQVASLGLKAASTAVNAKDEITRLIREGHKIAAIKLHRDTYGSDLFTAKTAVEDMEREFAA